MATVHSNNNGECNRQTGAKQQQQQAPCARHIKGGFWRAIELCYTRRRRDAVMYERERDVEVFMANGRRKEQQQDKRNIEQIHIAASILLFNGYVAAAG